MKPGFNTQNQIAIQTRVRNFLNNLGATPGQIQKTFDLMDGLLDNDTILKCVNHDMRYFLKNLYAGDIDAILNYSTSQIFKS